MFIRSSLMVAAVLFAAPLWAGQNIIVVLDDSGSMEEALRSTPDLTRMEAAKRALLTVLKRMADSSPETKVGVVLLNGSQNGNWIIPLAVLNQDQASAAIQGVAPAGGTPLGEFMKVGAEALLSLREKEQYGTYRLLIVTDGEATDAELVDRYLPDILARGISVDVIGVDMAENHSLATKVHTYRRADDPASLEQAISEVFAETSDEGGDASESDFEVLAAVPKEVAAAALQALSQRNNAPLGEQPGSPEADAAAVPGSAPPGAAAPRGAQSEDGGSGTWIVVFMIVVIAVVSFFSASRRRRR